MKKTRSALAIAGTFSLLSAALAAPAMATSVGTAAGWPSSIVCTEDKNVEWEAKAYLDRQMDKMPEDLRVDLDGKPLQYSNAGNAIEVSPVIEGPGIFEINKFLNPSGTVQSWRIPFATDYEMEDASIVVALPQDLPEGSTIAFNPDPNVERINNWDGAYEKYTWAAKEGIEAVDNGDGTWTVNMGDMAAGEGTAFQFNITAPQGQNFNEDLFVVESAMESMYIPSPVVPSIDVAKKVQPGAEDEAVEEGETVEFRPGDIATYTLSFENTGDEPIEISYVNDLSDLVDDGVVDVAKIMADEGLDYSIKNQKLYIEGTVQPGEAADLTYEVRVTGNEGGDGNLHSTLTSTETNYHPDCLDEIEVENPVVPAPEEEEVEPEPFRGYYFGFIKIVNNIIVNCDVCKEDPKDEESEQEPPAEDDKGDNPGQGQDDETDGGSEDKGTEDDTDGSEGEESEDKGDNIAPGAGDEQKGSDGGTDESTDESGSEDKGDNIAPSAGDDSSTGGNSTKGSDLASGTQSGTDSAKSADSGKKVDSTKRDTILAATGVSGTTALLTTAALLTLAGGVLLALRRRNA